MVKNKFIEESINENLLIISKKFFQLEIIYESQQSPLYESLSDDKVYEQEQDIDELKDSIKYNFTLIFNQFCVYLEEKNLLIYLNEFKKEFLIKLNNDNDLYAVENSRYDTIGYSVLLKLLYQYLSPFGFAHNKLNNSLAINYLENVLTNTQNIILKNKAYPSSETDVYKQVKNVLNVIFPSSKNPKSNFIKSFKCFKPDILIPEIKTAIEYKYADTESKLSTLIEQIYSDVQGYQGDDDYELFYAVFYVTKDFWGIKKFENVWKESRFPNNWKGIYIVGQK